MTYKDILQKYRLGVDITLPARYFQNEAPTNPVEKDIWSTKNKEVFIYDKGVWKNISQYVIPKVPEENKRFYIAYANSPDGVQDFSLTDSSLEYIGQFTDFDAEYLDVQARINNPSSYTWTHISDFYSSATSLSLHKYKPYPYVDVLEYEALLDIEGRLLKDTASGLEAMLKNAAVSSLTEDGVREYEKILSIIPDTSTESIEFRRERILNRLSLRPPFTIEFLYQRFDELIGKGMWDASFDKDTYTLTVETPPSNELWANEVLITVNRVKPANILFVSKPASRMGVLSNEEYSYLQNVYNYKMNSTWKLGAKPFVLYDNKGVIKMAKTPSLLDDFFEDILANNKITSVRFNGTLVKPATVTIDSAGNRLIVESQVAQGELTEVRKVEMLNDSGNVLSSGAVYMLVQEGLTFKNTISFKEGV